MNKPLMNNVSYADTSIIDTQIFTGINKYPVEQEQICTKEKFYGESAPSMECKSTSSRGITLTTNGATWSFNKKDTQQLINWLIDKERALTE